MISQVELGSRKSMKNEKAGALLRKWKLILVVVLLSVTQSWIPESNIKKIGHYSVPHWK